MNQVQKGVIPNTAVKVPLSGSQQQQVEKRAYEFYLERQKVGRSGTQLDDWLRAETEIRSRR